MFEVTWFKKGSLISQNTITARFNGEIARVAEGSGGSRNRIKDWLGGSRLVIATEEAVALGKYGMTLAVLTCHCNYDES